MEIGKPQRRVEVLPATKPVREAPREAPRPEKVPA
jgi:hypothetical protein